MELLLLKLLFHITKASGEFEGSVDLGAYYSGVEITVAVIGVTLGIALFIGMIKKARG